MIPPWHQLSADETLSRLASTFSGLSTAEAASRLAAHGPNALQEAPRRSPWAIFFGQFADFMIIVLILAAGIAGLLGEWVDTAVILAIVVVNAIIGFIQEYRAEEALAALQRLAAPLATVVRDGHTLTIPAAEIVPGDIVRLEAGGFIPADLRLLETAQLRVAEAALTGESLPTEKQTAPLPEAELPLGDRSNLCFSGTVVRYGRGLGVVTATGMTTELGRIASLLESGERLTSPLQRRLAAFGKRLSLLILAICAGVFAAGLWRGEEVLLIFLTAVSLAVAAIPEALPAVVTIALALGAGKLVRANALVRKLPAVETLGSVTVICSDKTGTLTENRMTVEEVVLAAGGGNDRLLGLGMALCNDADGAEGEEVGDPTEIALIRHAAAAGQLRAELDQRYRRQGELPFDSERKRMTTLHPWEGGSIAFTKGAPEALLAVAVAGTDQGYWEGEAARLANRGLRTLAFALRHFASLPEALTVDSVETELTILGLVGMVDPPRLEAAAAVAECRRAGIVPVMITGDHALTAQSIAERLGIVAGDSRVVSGPELSRMSDSELAEEVGSIHVYARIDPEQKLRIVAALQQQGACVAMTGDGVNDAPALQQADIGIAMGQGGTDVAREAADMVLLDDNFAAIVGAVREGRRIYDNIRKFTRYLLTTNAGEIVAIAVAPLFGLPLPLLPIHILWINLMTDALPALALSVEPAEGNVMARPPRPPNESLFARGLGWHALWVGALIGSLVLLIQGWALHIGDSHWQTLAFTVLCFTQLFHVLAIRSESASLFTLGLASNKPLLGAVLFAAALQLAVIYLPWCQPIFRTAPLPAGELAAAVALSSLVFWAVEGEKWWRRRVGTH